MYARNLFFAAAAAWSAAALPSPSASSLEKRDWVSDSSGNIKITFSDQTVKLGTAPISVVMDKLSATCDTSGQCETTPVDITGYQLVDAGYGSEIDDETITITPSGSYPTWIHNGLLEALGAAVNAVANCSNVTNQQSCSGDEFACSDPAFTVNECVVPSYWGINYQAADATDSAPPFIGNSVSVAINGNGFCSTFTTVGSAVAGAVNGAAGGIFTLLSLACQS